MESRLENLEAKLTLAEDLLEELNKTVYRQQNRIDRMQHELDSLREQLQTAAPAEPRNLSEEIPPHY
jgi:SlyX protein